MDKKNLARQIRRSARLLASVGYRCAPGPEPFHVVGISATDLCLVYVSEKWPIKPWLPDELRQVPAPQNCKRIIHHWRTRQRWPDVMEL